MEMKAMVTTKVRLVLPILWVVIDFAWGTVIYPVSIIYVRVLMYVLLGTSLTMRKMAISSTT